jgi:FkbH-like protein
MSATYKKCIVLDLDNTLWGGVVGEDGIEGIDLTASTSTGAAFMAFQQALLDLYHRGVLLAINSANNPEDALLVIRSHPNMILKEQHFVTHRINWDDKAANVASIAEELNIGLDSVVFFDDNPLHRAAVRTFLPDVEVPELPESPLLYAKTLLSLPYFPSHAMSNEDALRGNLYVTERLRQEAEKQFIAKEDFLTSLSLEAFIATDDREAVARIAQLTDKTNQFNTQKIPLTEEDVRTRMERDTDHIYTMRVTDRFGDYGLIGVVIVRSEGTRWRVEQFIMSCRILGRGVEDALLATLLGDARKAGATEVSFDFVPTEKNAPARTFLQRVAPEHSISPEDSASTAPPWITIHRS